jgi:8-oxo-dGTP pyrophosphatase MutT (NUDIX family)
LAFDRKIKLDQTTICFSFVKVTKVTGKFDLDSIRARLVHHTTEPGLEGDVPVAAVAVIINPNSRGSSILLIRRVERKDDPWSGQIAFPGGRRSRGDRNLTETAIREAGEEVGIQLEDHQLLGHLPMVATRTRQMRVLPVVFELKSSVSIRTNFEATEAFWLSSSDLERLEVEDRAVKIEGGSLTVPSYEYEGRVIWGLTFRILNLLLNRVTPGDL